MSLMRPPEPTPPSGIRPGSAFGRGSGQHEPEPFWRTTQFKIFVVLAAALVGLGVVGYEFARRAERAGEPVEVATERPATPTPTPSRQLTPEQLAERETRLSTAFQGALRDQSNGQDFAETTGYRRLLEQLAQYDAAELVARAHPELDYEGARADPDAWRGEFVRLRGFLGDVWQERLANPVLGRRDVWTGQMQLRGLEVENAIVTSLDPLFEGIPAQELHGRAVEVHGVFYRLVTFEARAFEHKDRVVSATWTIPWLLVRDARFIDGPSEPREGVSLIALTAWLKENPWLPIGALAFLVLGGRLVVYWIRARRRSQRPAPSAASIRELFEQRIRERSEQTAARATPTPPTNDG